MKQIILVLAFFATVSLSAQTMAYSVVEFKAKPHTQKDILNVFNETFEEVEMNQGRNYFRTTWKRKVKRSDASLGLVLDYGRRNDGRRCC